MNINEIRAQFTPVAIWMADATIREARKAITGNTGWNDVKRSPYNLPEVEMAGSVLFTMFETCAADVKFALLSMSDEMDGLRNFPGKKYFDEFVKALQAENPLAVHIREPNWILESR